MYTWIFIWLFIFDATNSVLAINYVTDWRPQLLGQFTPPPPPRQLRVGEFCESTMECPSQASCLKLNCVDSVCICNDGFWPSSDYSKCLQEVPLGAPCIAGQTACHGRPPSSMICRNAICECADGFVPSDDGNRCRQSFLTVTMSRLNDSCDIGGGNGVSWAKKCANGLECVRSEDSNSDYRCQCAAGLRPRTPLEDRVRFNTFEDCLPNNYSIGCLTSSSSTSSIAATTTAYDSYDTITNESDYPTYSFPFAQSDTTVITASSTTSPSSPLPPPPPPLPTISVVPSSFAPPQLPPLPGPPVYSGPQMDAVPTPSLSTTTTMTTQLTTTIVNMRFTTTKSLLDRVNWNRTASSVESSSAASPLQLAIPIAAALGAFSIGAGIFGLVCAWCRRRKAERAGFKMHHPHSDSSKTGRHRRASSSPGNDADSGRFDGMGGNGLAFSPPLGAQEPWSVAMLSPDRLTPMGGFGLDEPVPVLPHSAGAVLGAGSSLLVAQSRAAAVFNQMATMAEVSAAPFPPVRPNRPMGMGMPPAPPPPLPPRSTSTYRPR